MCLDRKADGPRWPLCNGRRETAVSVLGLSSPLCARCTAMCLGAATCAAVMTIFDLAPIPPPLAALGALPAMVDGYRSYFVAGGTTNWFRAVTGLTLGVAIAGAFS